jgi:hypothetical protein
LVKVFVHELTKQERAPYVAAFVRRLAAGDAERHRVPTGAKRERAMSPLLRKIVELRGRAQGATDKDWAEGCGWPSIAARATCQKRVDRFDCEPYENPKAIGHGITFRMAPKPAVDGAPL